MSYRKDSYFIGSRAVSGTMNERIADDRRRIQRGLQWAEAVASDFGWDHIWLITHTRDDLTTRMNPELVNALGSSNAKTLHRGDPASWGSLTMKNETFAGLLRGVFGGSMLVIYPRPELLDRVDTQRLDNVVTVVPGPPDVSAWIRKWNAIDPDTTQ